MQPRPWAGTVREPSVRVCMRRSCPAPASGQPGSGGPRPTRSVTGGTTRSLGQGTHRRVPPWRAHAPLAADPPPDPGAVSGAAVVAALAAAPGAAAPSDPGPSNPGPSDAVAPVQDFLAGQLGGLAAGSPDDRARARHRHRRRPRRGRGHRACARSPSSSGSAWSSPPAPPTRSRPPAPQPGVTYLEGNSPISFLDETSNTATRGARGRRDADRRERPGRWTAAASRVAVIDSGVDPTHPYLRNADGSSAVVANLKSVCLVEPNTERRLRRPGADVVDTDTISGGGHGTHVNGIVAGRPTHARPTARSCRAPPPAPAW